MPLQRQPVPAEFPRGLWPALADLLDGGTMRSSLMREQISRAAMDWALCRENVGRWPISMERAGGRQELARLIRAAMLPTALGDRDRTVPWVRVMHEVVRDVLVMLREQFCGEGEAC